MIYRWDNIRQNKKAYTAGFTVVELIIVIIVISILATITIVSYTAVTKETDDTVRRKDIEELKQAITDYGFEQGNLAVTGCGDVASNEGSGIIDRDYDGGGAGKSILACLRDANVLEEDRVDPKAEACTPATSPAIGDCHVYMKATCPAGTWLYANLARQSRNTTATDGTCQPNWDQQYGMNYVVRVK